MNRDNQNNPERMPPKKTYPFPTLALGGFTVLLFGMTIMAMLSLFGGTGLSGIIKALLISASATLVSYAINRFAIERGAELTATGFISAGIVSVFSILIVGFGLYLSTIAGLIRNDVDALILHEHGRAHIAFVGTRAKAAAEAGRSKAIVDANETSLRQYLACEEKESCLSGRGNGGRGSVTRALEELALRAQTIASQLADGERKRKASLESLNTLLARYQETLGQNDNSLAIRRIALVKIVGEIDQAVSNLDESMPVTLLNAYVGELRGGVSIPKRQEATRKINAILKRQAASLSEVLSTIEIGDQTRPVFPARAGVGTILGYLGHFLPITILVACVEMVFPLALWIYTLLAIVWAKHKAASKLPHTPPNKHSNPDRRRRRNDHGRGNRNRNNHNRDNRDDDNHPNKRGE